VPRRLNPCGQLLRPGTATYTSQMDGQSIQALFQTVTTDLLRSFIFFIYSYFFLLGFLDGKVGLIYHVLQAFWFRFLTDSKFIEMQLAEERKLKGDN
jgi:hypothetical protein